MRWTLLTAGLVLGGCQGENSAEPEYPGGPPQFKPLGSQDYQLWRSQFGPDIIDFDVQGSLVYFGPAQQGVIGLHSWNDGIRVSGIYDASNTTLLCRYEDWLPGGKTVVFGGLLVSAQSPPAHIFFTDGKVVYDGVTGVQRFSFKKDEIYQGDKRSAELVGMASVDLSRVSVERKLLTAALFSAQCGAPVLAP